MIETLLDILKDSLYAFPYLLLIYIIMEIIESVTAKEKIERAMASSSAPLVAGAFGVIPECGFSVMCAKLYENGLIKIGTLLTAFIATSDEGLVVLISNGVSAKNIILFLLWKIFFAVFIGELFNIIFKNINNHHHCPKKDDCMECGEHHQGVYDKFLFHPFNHAVKTFIYILILNFIFGFMFFFIGQDSLLNFTSNSHALQPLFSGLIGLIPNCASSIVLAEAYTENILSFSGLLAGLSTNAGIGLMILFKNKKNIKQTLIITLLLFISGVMLGYLSMIG